jgi:class 3 adenylate cyclase
MGDCCLAAFDGPARAIRCAAALTGYFRRQGREACASVHTGECEIRESTGLQGLAVEIAGDALALAEPGEVLVTTTVRDLVAGSGLRFAESSGRTVRHAHGVWGLLKLRDG